MTGEERLDFVRRAVKEMAAQSLQYLTQVVGVRDSRTGSFLGSGFFCELEGRKAIVTAGHVVRELEDQGFEGLVFTRGDSEPPAVVDGEVHLFGGGDLAIYTPSSEFPLPEGKRHWPGDRIETDPRAILRDYLVLAGFPGRFARATSLGGGGMTSEAMTYGAMMRYREEDIAVAEREQFDRDLPDYPFLPAGLLEPHEFAIQFEAEPEMFLPTDPDEEDARQVEDWLGVFEQGGRLPASRPLGPKGLSGSPVFRLGRPADPGLWSADCCRLVGVATKWLPHENVIVATSSTRLLAAFSEITRSVDG